MTRREDRYGYRRVDAAMIRAAARAGETALAAVADYAGRQGCAAEVMAGVAGGGLGRSAGGGGRPGGEPDARGGS